MAIAPREGIVTGILLAIDRIAGETAPLIFISLGNLNRSVDLNQPMASLPITLYQSAGSAFAEWIELALVGALPIPIGVLALKIIARPLLRGVHVSSGQRRHGRNGKGIDRSRRQQRRCTAPTIAVRPEVILFGEPTSTLDPISTAKIEEPIDELKRDVTIVIVTHNMQQAARCADQVAFFFLGELIECAPAAELFTAPKHPKTQEYITGRFG